MELFSDCCAARAERWAASAWKKFSLSVPTDLIILSDKLGIEIIRESLPDDVPGWYLETEVAKRIFINLNHPYPKRRFTLAHEIGHAAMSKVPCPKQAHRMFHITGCWRPDCHEIFCDRFATDVLMPRPLIIEACQELHHPDWHDKTEVLAARFEVSIAAMRRRLRELGLESKYRRYSERCRVVR
ncbi:ImmA/IrrE family metallo-endopeptidase [bacterium]|nr:ImmA/IrrE family metallo-endopeptidase [bacterium]